MLRLIVLVAAFAFTGTAHAQTAPSASDIASYTGLHLAAHEGRTDEIERLITAGADLNAVIVRAEHLPTWPPSRPTMKR